MSHPDQCIGVVEGTLVQMQGVSQVAHLTGFCAEEGVLAVTAQIAALPGYLHPCWQSHGCLVLAWM